MDWLLQHLFRNSSLQALEEIVYVILFLTLDLSLVSGLFIHLDSSFQRSIYYQEDLCLK